MGHGIANFCVIVQADLSPHYARKVKFCGVCVFIMHVLFHSPSKDLCFKKLSYYCKWFFYESIISEK